MDHGLRDNTTKSRFELEIDGYLVFADYRLQGSSLILPHVEAAPELRGKGAASHLMAAIMDLAREKRWQVVPLCGYAVAWIRRHKEYHDLVR
jgi:predicted GNAT family acetyltransferase